MSWVKLDDQFPEHRKVGGLSDLAFRLNVSAICYCARQLTNGFVAKDMVGRLAPRVRGSHVQELINADLWSPVTGGWQIHDYLEYNPSRAEVMERREAERKRKAKQRKAGSKAVDRNPDGSFSSRRDNQRDSARKPKGTPRGSHPLPDSPLGEESGTHLRVVGSPPAPAATGGTGSDESPDPPFDPEVMRAAAQRLRAIRKERLG
jgi:hypothetical protein